MFKSVEVMTRAGALKWAGMEIVPLAKSTKARWPFGTGGLIYNRPQAVLVRSEGGTEQELLIVDQTRRLQISILAFAALSLLAMWLLSSTHK